MFTAWIAAHRRSLLFLLLLPILAGLAASFSLPVTLFPNVSFPRVRLNIDAGDRPAEQMVLQVTAPIEQAVHSVPHVTDVRSTTSRGSAEVSIFFDWGNDMVAATLQVNAAVGQILPQLPPGSAMQTRRMDPTVFPIISYSMTSPTVPLTQMRDIALYQVRPLLAGIPGVANIGVSGGNDQEYHVLVDPAKLQATGVTVDDVANAIGASNVLEAIGRVEDRYKLYLVISNDTLHGVDALRKIAVRTNADGVIAVGDVATVELSTVPQWTRVTAAGRDAILLNIYEQPGGNSVEIAREVRARLRDFRGRLPAGIEVANWYDQSELVTASAASVRDAIIVGTVLAAMVLLVFLRSWRMTVIAMLVVPAALSATIALLWVMDMSFNIMTLGGMAAAVGLIIDDAIVMIEHVVRRVRERRAPAEANAVALPGGGVLRAAAEFARPLAGSSAATVVIFLPLAFLSGVTGAFFKALSLTMAASLVFSFVIVLLAVPLAAEWLLRAPDAEREDAGRLRRWFDRGYGWVATRLIRWPAVVALALALPLVALGYLAFGQVGTGFMPVMDEGGFIIDYYAAPGTALSETDRLLREVEAILKATPEVETWSRRTGLSLGGDLSEANNGDFFVKLKPGPRRPIFDVMSELRGRIETEVPGLNVEMAQLMEDLIGDLTAVPEPIEIKLFGDQPDVLLATARKVAGAIAKIRGVVEVRNGINPAGDALDIRIDRVKAAFEGIDPAEATRLVDIYLRGRVVTQIPTSLKQIGVRVWSPPNVRATSLDLANLPIRAPDGHIFPLQRIASIVAVSGQPQITRENLQHMVAVTARLEGRDLGSAAADVTRLLDQAGFLPASVRYELGGLYQQQQIAFRGLLLVFAAAAGAVFVLLLFLYERFSVAIAILIMPLLATCAVFIGLWLTAIELNITAMMGMTMIIGIVTEVAIFFFSEFDDLRASGMPSLDALTAAGRNRMRPIAMTTIAAILTLLPLALAIGQGSAMQQPLAIAIIAGLAVQLPLVLLVMPALYLVIDRAVARLARRRASAT
ncbi:MAG TPA: efflux RND transporter permease subunit [Xanthobacteraceae bacterium]